MFARRSVATLLGAGLTLACLTTGAAAHAAPTPGTHSSPAAGTAFSSIRTVTRTATIDGDRAIITLTGQAGQKITVHDSSGRPIAGTTLTSSTSVITFAAPSSHQEYTVQADGTDMPTAAFSLRDDIVTPDDKPMVDSVDKHGARAIVDVTAAPRALVKVKDAVGNTLGLRLADNQGHTSIPVPVAADDDTGLKVSQTNGGIESADRDAYSLTELASVDVTYTGLTDAIVHVEALTPGTLEVRDAEGDLVWSGPMSSKSGGSSAFAPVVDGQVTEYSITKVTTWGKTTPVSFNVDGTQKRTPLAAPTTVDLSGQFIQVHGVPGATLTIESEYTFPDTVTLSARGIYNLPVHTVPRGYQYRLTQSVGAERSPVLVAVVLPRS